jgi:hypothetical protein
LAPSRCSTVVKTSGPSPTFSMSCSRYSPGPKVKCRVSPAEYDTSRVVPSLVCWLLRPALTAVQK